ncbi:MAG: hypothetical protein KGJ60_02355 [Verrucomicrobiota bacterium]|nr:hypothetical protein [Verrucomicrobiota bacterium]
MNRLTQEMIEAIRELTEMRYEDPEFTGEESIAVKNGIVKIRVESWTDVCVSWAAERGLKIEDFDEEIFRDWQLEEAGQGFSLLDNSFDFDPAAGVFGQHFAFYFKPL